MTNYLLLAMMETDGKQLHFRCLEMPCREHELVVLHGDLEEHALEEHGDDKDHYKISDIEIGFDLVEDHPDRDRQKIKCRSCNKVISRTAALDHAKVTHTSDYVYIDLLT
jgi:hypothetical protein